MSYKKEVRALRKRLSKAKPPNDVWFIEQDAKQLRPETYVRFRLELRSVRERVMNSFHDPFHVGRRW